MEDLTKELMFNNNLIKNSFLNSLTAFDYVEKKHICPVYVMLKQLAKKSHTRLDLILQDKNHEPPNYIAYQHMESD